MENIQGHVTSGTNTMVQKAALPGTQQQARFTDFWNALEK